MVNAASHGRDGHVQGERFHGGRAAGHGAGGVVLVAAEQAVLAPRPVEAAQHLRAQEQEDRAADDGARQEQALDPTHLDAHKLPQEQGDSEDQECETDGICGHGNHLVVIGIDIGLRSHSEGPVGDSPADAADSSL